MKYTHRVKRAVAVGAAGAMLLTLSPVGVASANMHEPVCDGVPKSPFVDIAGNTFENEIDCLHHYGITTGTTPTTYSPGNPVQRGQMATFIVNAIEVAANAAMDEPAQDQFPDISGNVHRDNINKLAHADIVTGFPDGNYRPTRTVNRGQMATFVAGAIEHHLGETLPTGTGDQFPDISGNVHRDNINKLGNAGIVQGYGDGTYRASRDVSRGEMSKFIAWTLGYWHAQGAFAPTRPGQPTGTERPELVSAAIVETVPTAQGTPARPAGTYVRYTFDEEVGFVAPVATQFFVYTYTNDRYTGTSTIVESGNRSVEVRFGHADLHSATNAANLTLATVEVGAVRDSGGLENIEGDAPIGTARDIPTGEAGTTIAPDLQSVGGFGQADALNTTAIDFTFDEAAWTLAGAAFRLILIDASTISCTAPVVGSPTPGGGTVPGGNGTPTITVTCPNPTGQTTPIQPSQVARGAVDVNSVRDADNNPNVLQTVNVSPNTSTPNADLVSASFTRGTGANPDTVVYTFDQAVTGVTLGTNSADAVNFCVYNTNASQTCASGTANTVAQSADGTRVSVTFNQGTLANAVGASVYPVGNISMPVGNISMAEVGVANPALTQVRPGEVNAPQLTGVTLARQQDAFGQPTTTTATFTFDQPVDTTGNVALFNLYLASGSPVADAASCAEASTAATNDAIVCTFAAGTVAANAINAVVGTVNLGAVSGAVGQVNEGELNPEGHVLTSGGTGTPAS